MRRGLRPPRARRTPRASRWSPTSSGARRSASALARSHTGALAGSDAAMDAFFRDCGIVRVDMLETLVEIAPLRRRAQAAAALARAARRGGHHHRRRRGERGGPPGPARHRDRGARLGCADHRPHHGGDAAEVRARCSTRCSLRANATRCWPWWARPRSSIRSSPWSRSSPRSARAKPLAAFFTPHAERSLALLAKAGIAAFRTPEACADAFAAYFRLARAARGAGIRAGRAAARGERARGARLARHRGGAVRRWRTRPTTPTRVPYPVAVKIHAPASSTRPRRAA